LGKQHYLLYELPSLILSKLAGRLIPRIFLVNKDCHGFDSFFRTFNYGKAIYRLRSINCFVMARACNEKIDRKRLVEFDILIFPLFVWHSIERLFFPVAPLAV
jgi:hypothetical protein